MTYINTTTKKSYDFEAPEANVGDSNINVVPFPIPEAKSADAAATIAVTPNTQISVVTLGELTEAADLDVTPASDLKPGAMLIIVVPCGATPYDLTLNTGCEAGTVTGVANTTKKGVLVYDGSTYIPTGVAFD